MGFKIKLAVTQVEVDWDELAKELAGKSGMTQSIVLDDFMEQIRERCDRDEYRTTAQLHDIGKELVPWTVAALEEVLRGYHEAHPKVGS